jgi:hypothetical protein
MRVTATSTNIGTIMGDKSVVSIWYHEEDEASRHEGSANVQCLNPIVYRQFLNKTHPIGGYYVEFRPQKRNLEGEFPPCEANLQKWGFLDINTVLVNTVVTLQNQAPAKPSITKKDIESIVEEAVEKGNKKLEKKMQQEMHILKKNIVGEAHAYTEKMHGNLKQKIFDIQETLILALARMQQITGQQALPRPSELSNPE